MPPPSGQHFALKNGIPQNPVHLFSISLFDHYLIMRPLTCAITEKVDREVDEEEYSLCPDDGLILTTRQRVIGNCRF